MFSSIMSGAVCGIDSYIVHVEVDIAVGMPAFDMVGFLGSEVREARERVRTALKNTGISMPPKRITVNLSPANIRKQGAAFDLPIAAAIICSLEEIQPEKTEKTLIVGELSLDGTVNAVCGVLPIVLGAKKAGCTRCIVPMGNAKEGAAIHGIEVIGMESLQEMLNYLRGKEMPRPTPFYADEMNDSIPSVQDFANVQGQSATKRGLEVAAAGFHNVLMIGPPGAGKTMLARCIPSILPPMSMEESLEVSMIYSVSGLLGAGGSLMKNRPFVAPHHTVTDKALTGGGTIPRPGGISHAHRGVLFLDELAEFKRSTLEILRQPMEEHMVRIARTHGTYTYPSDFILVGAMNPCPCGHFPDLNRCTCNEHEIHRYLGRLSRPLLDRIDICMDVPSVKYQQLAGTMADEMCVRGESSDEIRMRVIQARNMQEERYRGTAFRFNADLDVVGLKKYCYLGTKESTLLEKVFEKMNLSARSYHRIIKVARTIADLDHAERITERHLSEAIHYKSIDKKYERR